MATTIKTAKYAVEISEEIARLHVALERLDDAKAHRLEIHSSGEGMRVGAPLNVHLDDVTKAAVKDIINAKLADAQRRLTELGFTL